ncbi:hypothetical protein [Paenibacillus guangzhouensis]|uniref:hypothetical protein n=1 Tax=Paenibacillus guangzhouensis TaxID=1473112 RepID=UPI001266A4F3|nr:hypothetical protein [Paenibacillus guangzhouensis]
MNPGLYRAYRLLGWGFVFEVIDFRVFYFDVLPDFVGYIMIATALQQLGSQHGIFKKAKWLSIGMIALSLPHVLMASNVTFDGFGEISLSLHIYSEALLACHVLIVYWICQGMRDIAAAERMSELQQSVVFRRNLYMFLAIFQLVFYPFLFNVEQSWINLLLLIGVLQMIMEVLFIRLLFRFSNRKIRSIDVRV